MKTKHSVHIMVIRSDGNDILPSILPRGLRLYTETFIKYPEEMVASGSFDQENGFYKTPRLAKWHYGMPHKLENLVLGVRKFLEPHPFKHLAA